MQNRPDRPLTPYEKEQKAISDLWDIYSKLPLSFILALKSVNRQFVLNLWTSRFTLPADTDRGKLNDLIKDAATCAAFVKTIGSRQVVFCNDGGLRIFKKDGEWLYEAIKNVDHEKDAYRIQRESAARLYQHRPIRDLIQYHATKINELFASKGPASTIDEWVTILNNPPPNVAAPIVATTQ